MKARDTVMNKQELEIWVDKQDYNSIVTLSDTEIAQLAQAEISFKAGYEQCAEELEVYLLKCNEAGQREVMEWAVQDCDCELNLFATHWQCSTCMQAKLKEWGL